MASVADYGTTPDGEQVRRFVLERDGVRVELIEYGASVVRVVAPDRRGAPGDVVLALGSLAAYWHDTAHLGAVPGRFANRVARGRFALDGRDFQLSCNEGPHHLHGGVRGLGRRVWRGEIRPPGSADQPEDESVHFEISRPDGDEGYPGRLRASARYTLGAGGDLRVELRARTDAPTLVNLTQHAYFHLGDGGATPVHEHWLEIAANEVLELDREGLPTGRRMPVAGTPFDLRTPTRLGDRIRQLARLRGGRGGFDHCFVLRGEGAAARLVDPGSGRSLTVETNQPGLQLYTGNFLDGRLESPSGIAYGRWHALCLEPQAFPDAPNHPGFPSARLDPGDEYVHHARFRLGVLSS